MINANENQTKSENVEIKKQFVYINRHLKWFSNGIHSLLSRADARGSADIITLCNA